MVDKTINDFGTIGSPATGDLLLVWDDSAGTTHKMPLSSVLNLVTSADGASFFIEDSLDPTGADGNNGDVWLRSDTSQIWGPKTGGAWGSPVQIGGGVTTVDIATASGAVELDLSQGNVFDVDMSGAITSWTISNISENEMGMLRVTNNSGGALGITWTGIDVPVGTVTSLNDGEELRAFFGVFA